MRHIARVAADVRAGSRETSTKKAIMESLRGVDGLRAKDAAALAPRIMEEQRRQIKALYARFARRSTPRYRAAKPTPPWERGTLEQRLTALIARKLPRTLKSGAAGGSSRTVVLTRDLAQVSYRVRMAENRDTYKGSYKGYAAAEDHHTITVPRAWMARVERRGLAVVDGLLTLDAAPLDAPQGVELFAAVWARQGRGYDAITERGYIARAGRHTYHAASVRAALAGLQRKMEGVVLAGPSMARLAELHSGVWVSLANVRAIGACEPGILNWVSRTNMQRQFAAGGATVAEIAAGYEVCPAPEARAAVMLAIRAARKAA